MQKQSFLNKLKFVSIGSAMADMALLLLIFFMAATSTEPPKGVEVELPESVTEGAEQDTLYLTISNKNRVYLDGKEVNYDQLNDELSIRQSEKDRVVSITADRNLDYKDISVVLEILKAQEFLNVVFMSQPRPGEKND